MMRTLLKKILHFSNCSMKRIFYRTKLDFAGKNNYERDLPTKLSTISSLVEPDDIQAIFNFILYF